LILFLFYAVLVWYFCLRYRRTWKGIAALVSGLLLVGLTARVYEWAMLWTQLRGSVLFESRPDARIFSMLLGVEAVIILIVGVFFLALPHRAAIKPCRKCDYELAGLELMNPTCPECGLTFAAVKPISRACPVCDYVALMDPAAASCAACEQLVKPRDRAPTA